jgi:IS5 family transposase
MKQRTLAMMTGFEQYTRKTRRAVFLEEMEQVVPWRELCALVEPHYPKPGNGRPPVGVERMLRIYFLQQWFNLSDPGVEEALYDSAVMRQFVGIDLGCEPAPDETTVCKFRHLLEEQQLGEQILGRVNLHLQAKGVTFFAKDKVQRLSTRRLPVKINLRCTSSVRVMPYLRKAKGREDQGISLSWPHNPCKSDGYRHVKEVRITEWPVEFLRHPRRTPNTIPDFLSPNAPANRLDILRGQRKS